MTRLRESIEKAATAPLTEDERQELPRHFVGLAQLHLKHLPVQKFTETQAKQFDDKQEVLTYLATAEEKTVRAKEAILLPTRPAVKTKILPRDVGINERFYEKVIKFHSRSS